MRINRTLRPAINVDLSFYGIRTVAAAITTTLPLFKKIPAGKDVIPSF